MNTEIINALKDTIRLAVLQENETGSLRSLLERQLPLLHRAIHLPEENPVDTLLQLVERYISNVPECIEAINDVTHEANISEYTDILLNIAADYFLHPPQLLDGHAGLYGLMGEAYLAHRLMEEINDRFIGHCGIPLAPLDMTQSNLIIHQLIGEPFANELDLAIQYSLEVCSAKEHVFKQASFLAYVEERKKEGWGKVIEQWPCLEEELPISLQFSQDISELLLLDEPPKSAIH